MNLSYKTTKNLGLGILIFLVITLGLIPSFILNKVSISQQKMKSELYKFSTVIQIVKHIELAKEIFIKTPNTNSIKTKEIITEINNSIKIAKELITDNSNTKHRIELINTFIKNAKLFKAAINSYADELNYDVAGIGAKELDELTKKVSEHINSTLFSLMEDINKTLLIQKAAVLKTTQNSAKISLIILFIGIVIGIITAIILSSSLIKPITNLIKGTTALAKGDLDHRVIIEHKDEIGILATAFNHMAINLKNQYNEIQSANKKLNDSYTELFIKESKLRETNNELSIAKQQAEAANIAKSKFLANVSHEIRTPLNAIMGFSEIIIGSNNMPEMKDQAKIILSESTIFLQLINDLLDTAKIESGKMEIESIPFDIYNLINSIKSFFEINTRKKGLDFNVSIEKTLPNYLIGDPIRIRQILINIANNAIKFTEKGYIHLIVKSINKTETTRSVQFQISDTGIGIPKEKQDKIFDSFTQADQSVTRKYGGTGLGTTIVKELVHLMKGEISLKSVPGAGTTFVVSIPLRICTFMPNKEELVDLNRESAVDLEKNLLENKISGNILLVEDYFPNQEYLRFHVENIGCKAFIADDGSKAIDACNNQKFDLIFMDVNIPIMDGFQTTKKIRGSNNSNSNTPIIGLTADIASETRKQCIISGMNDVITKPVNKITFISTIKKWLP